MDLHHPLVISSRLLPAVQVGDSWISLEPGGVVQDRLQWTYIIDTREGSYEGNDLFSAPEHTDDEAGYRAAFAALLSFLGAAAEAYRIGERSENYSLFSPLVMEWAYMHEDEVAMVAAELED